MAAITAITGLQKMTNLVWMQLDRDENGAETIDVSGLENLEYLDINDMVIPGSDGEPSLKNVILNGCSSLTELYIDDSDFSEGFPDLSGSGLNSLEWFDADQSNVTGSVDLTGLPALEGFDLSGNTELTEVIISSEQPLGGRQVQISNSGLTQTAVDNILISLSDNGINNGTVFMGGSNSRPGLDGVEAIRSLVGNGWQVEVTEYTDLHLFTVWHDTSFSACADTEYINSLYVYQGSGVEIGSFLYGDSELLTPVVDGWYQLQTDGISYQVSGGSGEITSSVACA